MYGKNQNGVVAVSDGFARQHSLRNDAQRPATEPESSLQRMHGLIAKGFPRDSLTVLRGTLYIEHHESSERTAL